MSDKKTIPVLNYNCPECNEDVEVTITKLPTQRDVVKALDDHDWLIECPECGKDAKLERDKVQITEITIISFDLARRLETWISQGSHDTISSIKVDNRCNTLGEAIDILVNDHNSYKAIDELRKSGIAINNLENKSLEEIVKEYCKIES